MELSQSPKLLSQESNLIKPKPGKKKQAQLIPSTKITRKKNIDFSKLGQKITLSNSTCHKCKTMIPVYEENICKGPMEQQNNNSNKKQSVSKKKSEACSRRFCNDCLQKQYPDSWIQIKKNPDNWICPVCLDTCNCSQCTRKRAKESQQKTLFLAQFDQPEKVNKRNEKLSQKQQKSLKVIQEAKKPGRKQIQQVQTSQRFAISQDDWNNYQKAKHNFYDVLNKYDWSDFPTIQKLKERKQSEEEEEKVSQDSVFQIQRI